MQLVIELTGISPLLMHNPRLADPDDDITREIAKINSKQAKTADDREHRQHLEFLGGLYTGDDGPVVPGLNIRACWIETAKSRKLGTAVGRAVIIPALEFPLEYDGPRDPEETCRPDPALLIRGRLRRRRRLRNSL